MKGSVNTPSCRTVPDQLIGAPHSTSMMPWRIAENSRVWSPCTSDAPGYCLMFMRPFVLSLTRLAKISPPLPQANAVGTTVDILYSALYCWARTRAGKPSIAAPAAPFRISRLFMVVSSSFISVGLDASSAHDFAPALLLFPDERAVLGRRRSYGFGIVGCKPLEHM